MTKAGILYHNMRYLLKNKNAHTMVNDSRFLIPQVEQKNKQYTSGDLKRADLWKVIPAHQFPTNKKNPTRSWWYHSTEPPIFWEDFGMDEDIYRTSVPHLEGKQYGTRFSMWNLLWYQVSQRTSLTNTIKSTFDVFQPKMVCLLSFSGMYQNLFLYCRKMKNSR